MIETEKAIELASANAYLMIAKRCVENARTRPCINEVMGVRLEGIYDVLGYLLDEIHKMASEEE
jgi:hypothetical protein